MIFKVLGSIVYCIMNNDICADYLCCQQAKLQFSDKGFETTTLNDISGIRITELLTNVISYHEFVNNKKSTFILSCIRKLVDYYQPTGFVIIVKNSSASRNVPLRTKQIINEDILHNNDIVMEFYKATPSAENTLKSITICSGFYRDFASTY